MHANSFQELLEESSETEEDRLDHETPIEIVNKIIQSPCSFLFQYDSDLEIL